MGARDYKNARRSPRGRAKPAGAPWRWFVAGLVCGLLISVLFYERHRWPIERHLVAREPAHARTEAGAAAPAHQAPAAKPKPRFEFYTLLPKMQMGGPGEQPSTPAKKPPTAHRAPAKAAAPAQAAAPAHAAAPAAPSTPASGTGAADQSATTGSYLQVASLRRAADANRMKAQLLLLGLPVVVQEAQVNGTARYRVRVGPYDDAAALDAALTRLHEHKISAIKVGG